VEAPIKTSGLPGSGPAPPARFDDEHGHCGFGPNDFGDLEVADIHPVRKPRYDGAVLAAFVSVSLLVHVGIAVSLLVFPVLWQLLAFLKPPPPMAALHFEPIQVDLVEIAKPEPDPEPVPEVAVGGRGSAGAKKIGILGTKKAKRDLERRIARNAGILGVLSSKDDSAKLSGIFGKGDFSTGDDQNALGGLIGTEVGESWGTGGLGLRGTGRGGGGTGEGTIGLGGIGTIGRGGGGGLGTGSGYGRGVGRLGGRTSVRVNVTVTRASGLPKDIARRILRRARHQMRYCYERALKRDPKLAGKLSLDVRISSTGAVRNVVQTGATIPSDGVRDCVKRLVKRLRFPRPEATTAELSIAVRFTAS
jgi:hypothetical protein